MIACSGRLTRGPTGRSDIYWTVSTADQSRARPGHYRGRARQSGHPHEAFTPVLEFEDGRIAAGKRRAALAAEHLVEAATGRSCAQVLLAGRERERVRRDLGRGLHGRAEAPLTARAVALA